MVLRGAELEAPELSALLAALLSERDILRGTEAAARSVEVITCDRWLGVSWGVSTWEYNGVSGIWEAHLGGAPDQGHVRGWRGTRPGSCAGMRSCAGMGSCAGMDIGQYSECGYPL